MPRLILQIFNIRQADIPLWFTDNTKNIKSGIENISQYLTKKMNQWVLQFLTFLRVQETTCKIDSLYQFQIICTELIPVDFSFRLVIWNPQTGMLSHVEGLSTYFLFLSNTLFASCYWSTMSAWFNIKCPHQWKENRFQYLRIRSREWQVISFVESTVVFLIVILWVTFLPSLIASSNVYTYRRRIFVITKDDLT